MDSIINREASEKTKGYRFQKIRACIRLLEKINSAGSSNRFSCAIELLEDSFLVDENENPAISLEENKYYTSSLTFNAKPIRNTIVAFLDLSFRYLHDPKTSLCVFASATIGDERPSETLLTSLGIEKKEPCSILKNLIAKKDLSDDEIKICHRIVLDEYAEQYKDREGGNLGVLEKWTPKDIADFVKRIEWEITEVGNDKLESEALQKVRDCPYFSSQHEGLEEFILAAMLNRLERFSEEKGAVAKLLNTSDVELIFVLALGKRGEATHSDPAHQTWSSIKTTDMRTLEQKITDVVPTYSAKKMSALVRKCALAKYEAELFGKEYVSLRRRLYDVCEEVLNEKIDENSVIDSATVDDVLSEIKARSVVKMKSLSQTFTYQIKDEDTINGAILSLFDECYAAFDDAV